MGVGGWAIYRTTPSWSLIVCFPLPASHPCNCRTITYSVHHFRYPIVAVVIVIVKSLNPYPPMGIVNRVVVITFVGKGRRKRKEDMEDQGNHRELSSSWGIQLHVKGGATSRSCCTGGDRKSLIFFASQYMDCCRRVDIAVYDFGLLAHFTSANALTDIGGRREGGEPVGLKFNADVGVYG